MRNLFFGLKYRGNSLIIALTNHAERRNSAVDKIEYQRLFLDETESIAYLSDPVTYELLYLNSRGMRMLGLQSDSDYRGQPCYRVLQGRDTPCEFCTTKLLREDRFYVWSRYNEIFQQHSLIYDKLVRSRDGRPLRMEIAYDVTRSEQEKAALSFRLAIEETLIRCVQTLAENDDMQRAVEDLLHILAGYYQGARAYIFEFDSGGQYLSNTYEWCAPGISSERENLQNIPRCLIDRWLRQFQISGEFFITSLGQELDPESSEYKILAQQGIQSLIAAPLKEQGVITGFIGVDNPAVNTHDLTLLRSVTIFVVNDIQKRRLTARLERISFRDLLTGLYNRNKYISVLQELELHPPASLGAVFMDLNGLKSANDSLGHKYGDSLLCQVAELIDSIYGDQAFRVGGDEFVALCPGIDRETFDSKLHQLRQKAESTPSISVSIGATWETGADSVSAQINRTDRLMYLEKQSYYKQLLQGEYNYRSSVSWQLFTALQENRFLVHLQPKVELGTGALVGAEALVRRREPDGTLLIPERFLPFYERENVIRHIDFFVLDQVCAALHRWRAEGLSPVPLSVNFSSVTLMEPDVADSIQAVCRKYGLPAALIRLELSHDLAELTVEDVQLLAERLQKMGFSLSLDHFGVGYSNALLFTAADFDELKLSRSLIAALPSSEKARAIAGHTAALCQSLGTVQSVAEGIETQEQLELLQGFQFRYGQGLLFAPPMPVEEFERRYLRIRTGAETGNR